MPLSAVNSANFRQVPNRVVIQTRIFLDDARAGPRPPRAPCVADSARKVAEAGNRSPLLKPLLERCLCLHAEDRPSSAEALRALEGLRADPCAYRPAGHGAGVLADRWFKVWGSTACVRSFCMPVYCCLDLAWHDDFMPPIIVPHVRVQWGCPRNGALDTLMLPSVKMYFLRRACACR